MLSMKTIVLTFCMLLVAATTATAGHQADYTMSISMDQSAFGDMAAMFGEQSGDTQAGDLEALSDMTLVHGKVYWHDVFTRVDMFYDPEMAHTGDTTGLQTGDMVESFIIFGESGTSYQLLHAEKRAVQYDNAVPGSSAAGDDPIPDMQPDRMIRDYQSMISSLQETEGMQVTELAPATINGVSVKGVSFIMDMQAMMAGMEGMEGMPDMSALFGDDSGDSADAEGMEGMEELGGLLAGIMAMMGDISGELWFSDELDVMMRMNMSLMGMSTTMELDSIFNWEDDGDTFAVPDDYEIITQEQYMQEQMAEFNKVMDGLDADDNYNVKEDGAKISGKGSS